MTDYIRRLFRRLFPREPRWTVTLLPRRRITLGPGCEAEISGWTIEGPTTFSIRDRLGGIEGW